MTTAQVAEQPAAITPGHWWILLLEGIAAIIIGLLLITDPGTTLLSLVVLLGVWWFIGGIIDLVRLFSDHTNWGWRLFSGILGIIAGLMIVRHPLTASILVPATLVWLLGGLGVVIGAIGIYRAFKGEGWGTGIVAALSLILGIILLGANAVASTVFLLYMAAIWGIVGGIFMIVFSFRLRNA